MMLLLPDRMEVIKVYWWKHNCKSGQCSSAKVHRTLQIKLKSGISVPASPDDYEFVTEKLDGLDVIEYEGV